MEKCFVIQPFDNDKFDRRYLETFKPGIEKAGLEPYRIDKDFSVRIPIDDIEKGISECVVCFADITLDNPNVWYELGYAFACKKDIIMVCADERTGNYPFDIQHRQIIKYKAASKSDFETLEDSITKKILALLHNSKTVRNLNSIPVIETEGLKGHEVAILIILTENQLTSEESIAVYNLKSLMNQAGYTDVATSVGIKTLVKQGLITTFMLSDNYNNEPYAATRLTEAGENWVMSNQDQLVFRMQVPPKKELNTPLEDDLPF
jgi:hypothetical protein